MPKGAELRKRAIPFCDSRLILFVLLDSERVCHVRTDQQKFHNAAMKFVDQTKAFHLNI